MATAVDYRRHVRRPVGFVVLGALLLVLAAGLLLDSMRRKSHSTVLIKLIATISSSQLIKKFFISRTVFMKTVQKTTMVT